MASRSFLRKSQAHPGPSSDDPRALLARFLRGKGRSGLTRSMRQRRSGPGSPDHIRTSFPDQFFAVTNLRADAYNRCILQFREIPWPQKNAAANRANITGGQMDSLDFQRL